MTESIKQYAWIVATVALLVAVVAWVKIPEVTDFTKPTPSSLGAVGNLLAEEYDPYVRYNGGIKSALELFITGSSTLANLVTGDLEARGTTTVERSFDGFVAGGSLGTSATTTPVQTLYTNTGGNIACDASTMALHVLNRSVFNGAQSVSVGTTTTSGATTDNLIASSTMATSSPDVFAIESYIGDNAGVFIMQPQDKIQISLRDGDSAAADTTEITASSTNYASRDIEFGIYCWNLGI